MSLHTWYIPSWNGDIRLEVDPKNPDRTVLSIEKPTEDEKKLIEKIDAEAAKRGWAKAGAVSAPLARWRKKGKAILDAPVALVGSVVAEIARPGPAVLTALRLAGGKVVTVAGSDVGKLLLPEGGPYRDPPEALVKVTPAEPAVAATVRRPTPSCPAC